MSKYATIFKPPPEQPHHSPIESILSLLPLVDLGPDIYSNAQKLWHPPGARGIFGGAAIAQCLAAAQATIPANFTIHSMHCYFVLAGHSDIPVIYYVDRVRDGKSFITRTVQARQRGKVIFTTTMSFMCQGSGGRETVQHQNGFPADVQKPPDRNDGSGLVPAGLGNRDDSPFESLRCRVKDGPNGRLEEKRYRQWVRARGKISDAEGGGDNHQAHLIALAYMSDSYFIGTVARAHNLMRFASSKTIANAVRDFKGSEEEKKAMKEYFDRIAKEETEENEAYRRTRKDFQEGKDKSRSIGMMVSLDHTIFFHNPRAFRADEWMLTEMQSPWAGDGRGLVLQSIWSRDGTLIATCTQEGVVRLQQKRDDKL